MRHYILVILDIEWYKGRGTELLETSYYRNIKHRVVILDIDYYEGRRTELLK